jgi:response regulator of citrate/malate metabolism
MVNDLELYRRDGIHDCLAKPFTSQELWKFLTKYLSVESLLITEPNDENIQKTADTEKILELMEKLESMLADSRAECVNLLDDIKTIPGAENLARCVEEFEFEQAITELSDLRKRLV